MQDRLAAEHLAADQQKVAQQQADLEAREKALADRQSAPPVEAVEATATPRRAVAQTTSVSEPDESVADENYGTFYQKLEPYGAWLETEDYGYVFQPNEAEQSRNWRPYNDGRWVYSDVGWTWVSEEAFGWATYHYGRWTRLKKTGWVWVPGKQWAPAWVSFRKNNDYVGWAPLPPEAHFERGKGIHNWADSYYDIGPEQYSFVRANEFGSRPSQRNFVPADQNITIVNETTNVTNITFNNTAIVNGGPSYDDLRARSAQPIERVRLDRRTATDGEFGRPVMRGDVLEMSAPPIERMPGTERPRTVKERLGQTVVERGWSGIADRSAADRARAKVQAEATPPPDAPFKGFRQRGAGGRGNNPPPAMTPAASTRAPIAAATAAPTTAPVVPPAPIAQPTVTVPVTVMPTAAPVMTPPVLRTPPNRAPQQQQPLLDQNRREEEALRREQFRKNKMKAKEDQTLVPTPVAPAEPRTAPNPETPAAVAPPVQPPRQRPNRPVATPSETNSAPVERPNENARRQPAQEQPVTGVPTNQDGAPLTKQQIKQRLQNPRRAVPVPATSPSTPPQ